MSSTILTRRSFLKLAAGLGVYGLVGGDSLHAQEVAPAAQAVTGGPSFHFFGYYDKCPWDSTGWYMLAHETTFSDRAPGPEDEAVIGVIDRQDGNRWHPLDRTRAWNFMQGAMLQWLPSAPDRLILYNQWQDGQYTAVIRDVFSGETRTLPLPVAAVSPDGRAALSLNFSRQRDVSRGYEYAPGGDPHRDDLAPADDGMFWMNLETGDHRLVVSLEQLAGFEPDDTMRKARHTVFPQCNFSPDGQRFAIFHRWRTPGGPRVSRLLTANVDGTDLHTVVGPGLVSHWTWRNPQELLVFTTWDTDVQRYYLFKDRSDDPPAIIGEEALNENGHATYSRNGRWLLTDTYPNKKSLLQTLILYDLENERRTDLGQFSALVGRNAGVLWSTTRCDLHPRWNRDSTQICFDSPHEGTRQVFVMDAPEIVKQTR